MYRGFSRLVVDTDIIIYDLNGLASAKAFFDSLRELLLGQEPLDLYVSVVSLAELLASPDLTEAEQATIRRKLTPFRVVPVEVPIGLRAASIRRGHKRAGRNIKLPDALIAATALQLGAAVVTNNMAHFAAVEELPLINPIDEAEVAELNRRLLT